MHNTTLYSSTDCVRAGAEANIMVALTFHYDRNRLRYFAEVVRYLSLLVVNSIEIHVFVNSDAEQERNTILGAAGNCRIELHFVGQLEHPFNLTWAHKTILKDKFCEQMKYTHFLYLEDDEIFTSKNFIYFIYWREWLRPFGLLPGFARVEWNDFLGAFVNTDNINPIPVANKPHVRVNEMDFMALDNPYCGCFILDRSLAEEYVASPSFDRDLSAKVSEWGVRERAAMGLMFERPPEPFAARLVVPVISGGPPPEATIRHFPDNYAQEPTSCFGKVRIIDLYTDALDPSRRVNPAGVK